MTSFLHNSGLWSAAFGSLAAEVFDGSLKILRDGGAVGVFTLAPAIDGAPTQLNAFIEKNGRLITTVDSNADISVALWIEHGRIHYRMDCPGNSPINITCFPQSTFHGPSWATFVSDEQDSAWPKSQARSVKVASAVDIDGETAAKAPARWVIAPPPRACALQYDAAWLSLVVPDALPIAETVFNVDSDAHFSIDFNYYLPDSQTNAGIEVIISGGLNDRYDAIDELAAVSRQRGLTGEVGATPDWWSRPLFCTWGEQVALESPDASAAKVLTADNVRRWVESVTTKLGTSAFNIIIDAPWFKNSGDYEAHPTRFGGEAGLRELIDELHAGGHKVLLWMTPFDLDEDSTLIKTVPDAALRLRDGGFVKGRQTATIPDYTNPGVRAHFETAIRRIMRDLDADGLKVDFLYACPDPRTAMPHDQAWGIGDKLLFNIARLFSAAARAEKPDALISFSSVMPYLQPHVGAIRMNDNFSHDVKAWHRRARLITRALPGTVIDTDAWPLYADDAAAHWLSAPAYGVPAVYHLTKIDDDTPMTDSDFRLIAACWAVYANAPVRSDQRITVDPEAGVIERRYADMSLAARCVSDTALITYSDDQILVAALGPVDLEIAIPEGRLVTSAEIISPFGAIEPLRLDDPHTDSPVCRIPDAREHGHYVRIRLG